MPLVAAVALALACCSAAGGEETRAGNKALTLTTGAGRGLTLTWRSGGAAGLSALSAGGSRVAGPATVRVTKRTGGALTAAVTFGPEATATVAVDADGAVSITPGAKLAGVAVEVDMACAVIPGRWVGQTIRNARDWPPGRTVHLPPENLLLGLAPGGGRMIVLAWPTGTQRVTVVRNDRSGGKARFASARVMLGGSEIHIAAFDAEGIWHRAALREEHLEKDIDLGWRRPFAAQWVTQLKQNGVPTTVEFVTGRRRQWSPDLGYFTWPARFEGSKGYLLLGKKLPPVGEALIFPLAGHPATPFEFLRRMLSAEQRRLVTELGPTRAGYDLVKRPSYVWPAHCSGERKLRGTILAVGLQRRERALLASHTDERVAEDLCVARMAQRHLDFLTGVTARFKTWSEQAKGDRDLLSALAEMKRGLARVQATYDRLMKDFTPKQYEAHILATAERFKQAIQEAGTENRAELIALLDALNEPKNRVESMGKDFGGGVRQWFHEVGAICAARPAAVPYATAVREAIRRVLEVRQFEAPGRYWKDMR